MAVTAICWTSQLDDGLVLGPERYDPRTRQCPSASAQGRTISELADLSRDTLQTQKLDTALRYIVLDTGDAHNGIISFKIARNYTAVGSAKKLVQCGDVIISRLRPYLRQVGLVDEDLVSSGVVVASTEFYVLRSKDKHSIAYLAPFLLSEKVQRVLAASQEGGHHPRFPEKTLLSLLVPTAVLNERDKLSKAVEDATVATRRAEKLMLDARGLAEDLSTEGTTHVSV